MVGDACTYWALLSGERVNSKRVVIVGGGCVVLGLGLFAYLNKKQKQHKNAALIHSGSVALGNNPTVTDMKNTVNFIGDMMGNVLKRKPRGIRNNNPLNIRESKGDRTNWKGERKTDDDKAFEEFTHVKYGFRAATRILRSYQKRGINTVYSIVHTFAPAHENNSDHYVNFVCRETGFDKNQMLDVRNEQIAASLLRAMAKMEVGHMYPMHEVMEGVKLA